MTRWPFLHTPWPCRALMTSLVVAAVAASARGGTGAPSAGELAVVAALLCLLAVDVEVGRRAEGGRVGVQRPHKGLSAWPLAGVLAVGAPWAALLAVPAYALVRWRGMHVQLWKYVGSCAIVVLGASVALEVARLGPTGVDAAALGAAGWRGPAVLVLAVAAFLVVEAVLLWGCALAGDPADEQWLRAQLRTRSFYAGELAVLCQAVVLAVLVSTAPLVVLFAAPSYAVLHRALLHAPLREAADRDAKTGLLTYPAWSRAARDELGHRRPVAVLLVDLDHFKDVNDRHGHLVGDAVLVATADALQAALRPEDLLGRFGGEEFCVLLPGADVGTARAVAERLRQGVAGVAVEPGRRGVAPVSVTASVGAAVSLRSSPVRLEELVGDADEALYAAKAAGRDRVHVPVPGPEVWPRRIPAQWRPSVPSREG